MSNASFRDFYEDDTNVSPTERARIEFEVELIGKLIEAREAKGLTQEQLAQAAGLRTCLHKRFNNVFIWAIFIIDSAELFVIS